MRFLLSLFLLLLLGAAQPALAQEDQAAYRIDNLQVDITAESAAKARDEAVVAAQREAFYQLLDRLGTEDREPPTTDEVIASLVQAFEIHKEHVRGVRYTGTMSVQFRPTSVRELFGFWGSEFVDARAEPVVILPLWLENGRATLWEEPNDWRSAWEEQAKQAGLVPLIVPTGDLEDIAQISTKEALEGNRKALRNIIAKHNAGGVCIIAIDYTPARAEAKQAQMFMARYDKQGSVIGSATKWEQSLSTEETALAMLEATDQVINKIEQNWRNTQKLPSGAPVFLPIDVEVPTLADWVDIRKDVTGIPLVTKAHVVTMRRGLVHIELEFRGDIPVLQDALREKGLELRQSFSGSWIMRKR